MPSPSISQFLFLPSSFPLSSSLYVYKNKYMFNSRDQQGWKSIKTSVHGFVCLLNNKRNHTRLLLWCDLEHTALSVPQFLRWEMKSLD